MKSVAALPKTLATGSILEPGTPIVGVDSHGTRPQSYVNTSCPVEVVPEEEKVMEVGGPVCSVPKSRVKWLRT